MKALRVLIIEDEAMIALLFAEVLVEMGHVVCATEATEAGAVAAASRFQPDLIISDVRLREGSGIEAVNAIVKSGFIPHVFVSGDVQDPRRFNPAASVLLKPFSEGQLVAAIARATEPANVLIGQRRAGSIHAK